MTRPFRVALVSLLTAIGLLAGLTPASASVAVETRLTIIDVSRPMTAGGEVEVTLNLSSNEGGVVDQPVVVALGEGQHGDLTRVRTDEWGRAIATIKLKAAGTYSLSATFAGSRDFGPSSYEQSLHVDYAYLDLAYVGDFTGVLGKPFRLAAQAAATGGRKVEGLTITFSLLHYDERCCGGTLTRTYSAVTDESGLAAVTILPLMPLDGASNLRVEFAGTDVFAPGEYYYPFVDLRAVRYNVSIVDGGEGYVTNPIRLDVRVEDVEGAGVPLETGRLGYWWEGSERSAPVGADGTATLELVASSSGPTYLEVAYFNDVGVGASTIMVSLGERYTNLGHDAPDVFQALAPTEFTTTVTGIPDRYLEGRTVTGTVWAGTFHEYSEPPSSAVVSTFTSTVGAGGITTVSMPALEAGLYTFRLESPALGGYARATTSLHQFEVYTRTLDIQYTGDTTGVLFTPARLAAVVRDAATGLPVEGIRVDFSQFLSPSRPTSLGTAITDPHGVATLGVSSPYSGTVVATVPWQADVKSTSTATVFSTAEATMAVEQFGDTSVQVGEPAHVGFRVTHSITGAPLANARLYLSPLAVSTHTDANGVVDVSFTPTIKGPYSMSVDIHDNGFQSSRFTRTLTVLPRASRLEVSAPEIVVRGEAIEVTVRAEDLETSGLPGFVKVTARLRRDAWLNSSTTIIKAGETATFRFLTGGLPSDSYDLTISTTSVTYDDHVWTGNVDVVWPFSLQNDDGKATVHVDPVARQVRIITPTLATDVVPATVIQDGDNYRIEAGQVDWILRVSFSTASGRFEGVLIRGLSTVVLFGRVDSPGSI